MAVQVSLQYAALAFIRYTPKSGTVESYRSFSFSFCCCLLEPSILISIVTEPIFSPTRGVEVGTRMVMRRDKQYTEQVQASHNTLEELVLWRNQSRYG